MFKHLHSSNWYGSSIRQLRAAMRKYVSRGASLITLTEVEAELRESVLREFTSYGLCTGDLGNRNDCAILWKRSEWIPMYAHNETVTDLTSPRPGGGETDKVAATIVALRHRATRNVLVLTDCHTPSSVQDKGRLTRGKRGRVWLSVVHGWRRLWNRVAREYHADAVMAVADWNVDFRLKWVRGLIRALFPSMRQTWGTDFPPNGKGTHRGGRVIDATLIRGDIELVHGPELVPGDDDSTDHTPYEEVFRWLA